MTPTRITTILLSFFISLSSFSQMEFPGFGKFTAEEISLKQCSFDPEAEAIILLDQAVVKYDDEWHMITERRIRIKILNERGLDRGNIIIPFYSKDGFEYLSTVQAYTFNFDANGMQPGLVVDKKSFHTEKKNNYYSLLKFAMPAVKAGSILEYHYISTMKHYGGLDEWEFQSNLPTLKSSYLLQILPNREFAYSVQKKFDINISIKPMPNDGKVYFEMNNVPALRIEPYMDAPRDYVQKVIFQLSGYTNNFGSKMNVNTTWKSLATELMTEKNFGSQLDKDLKIDELKKITEAQNTEYDKLKSIYDFIKKNIAWNGYDGKYVPDGLKTVWERKKGSAGEINLLLVNLLKSAGIETFPVLAAERDFGKVDTIYPFVDRFNKTIAFAIADGKQYLLDATQENCPPGLTPYALLNTTGFLVDRKKYNLINISPGNKSYKNIIKVTGDMNAKGELTAEANVKSYEYARQLRLDAVKSNRRNFINENFEKGYEGLTIDSFLVSQPQSDTIPFEQIVSFKQQLNESGGFIFVNANFFTGLEKNPFISPIRFTNVNFGYPYNIFIEETIKLPPGTKVDLPENKNLASNDNMIQAAKQVSFENNELKILINFVQKVTLVKAANYPDLKSFYKEMTDMLNEPIVLKISN